MWSSLAQVNNSVTVPDPVPVPEPVSEPEAAKTIEFKNGLERSYVCIPGDNCDISLYPPVEYSRSPFAWVKSKSGPGEFYMGYCQGVSNADVAVGFMFTYFMKCEMNLNFQCQFVMSLSLMPMKRRFWSISQ